MVEGQRFGQSIQCEDAGIARIVGGLELAAADGRKDYSDSVVARIAGRVRISPELPEIFQGEACFLQGFPARSLLQGFAVVYKSARNGPAVGRIASFDEHDASPWNFYDDIHGEQRVTVNRDHCAALGAFDTVSSHQGTTLSIKDSNKAFHTPVKRT